eukprot:scaffold2186_cov133-Isochrysis_galbana.AAC.3
MGEGRGGVTGRQWAEVSHRAVASVSRVKTNENDNTKRREKYARFSRFPSTRLVNGTSFWVLPGHMATRQGLMRSLVELDPNPRAMQLSGTRRGWCPSIPCSGTEQYIDNRAAQGVAWPGVGWSLARARVGTAYPCSTPSPCAARWPCGTRRAGRRLHWRSPAQSPTAPTRAAQCATPEMRRQLTGT